MKLIFILSESERSVKFREIEFPNIKNANTAKLLIPILINISECQKGISLMILLHSNTNLILLPKIKRTQSSPHTLKLMIMLELHIKVTAFITAQLHMFLDIALPVNSGLEIQAFHRELDFNLVGLRELFRQVALGLVV